MVATIARRNDEWWLVLTDEADRRPSYALIHALGGWLRGFRPVDGRFESRLTFRERSREAEALAILTAGFDRRVSLPTSWTHYRAGNAIAVNFGGAADPALSAAFDRLSARLGARGSPPRGFAALTEGKLLNGFEADSERLAVWLARALWVLHEAHSFGSDPTGAVQTQPIGPPDVRVQRQPITLPGWQGEMTSAIRNGHLAALWPPESPWAVAERGGHWSDLERTLRTTAELDADGAVRVWCIAAALCRRIVESDDRSPHLTSAPEQSDPTEYSRTVTFLPRAWYTELLLSPSARLSLDTVEAARSRLPPGTSEHVNPRTADAPMTPPIAAERYGDEGEPAETLDRSDEPPLETPSAGAEIRSATPARSPSDPDIQSETFATIDPALLTLIDLEGSQGADPGGIERRARELLATASGQRYEPRLRLIIAKAKRDLGETRQEPFELRQALAAGPARADEFDAALALGRVLEVRGCSAAEDAVVGPWLAAVTQIGADETLLLLAAEAATVHDRELAAALMARAVPGRGATIGPQEAVLFLDRLNLTSDRLNALLLALDRAGFPPESDAANAVAELRGGFDPLDGDILARLVELDVAQGATWLPDRLDNLLAACSDDARSADPRRLVGIVRPLYDALDYLFRDLGLSIDTERLHRYSSLAVRAALAAGEPSRAWSVVVLANGSATRRLQRAQIVDLADLVAVHPTALSAELAQHLIDLYLGVGSELLERRGRAADRLLLTAIIWALRDLDPQIADDLAAESREIDGSPEAAIVVEAEDAQLSGRLIVIFGADAPTRLRARERLTALGAAVRDVPPAYERNLTKDEIRQQIGGADLVVEVWRQLKHRDSDALDAALTSLHPRPDRRRAAGTGKSSIVRAALEWAASAA